MVGWNAGVPLVLKERTLPQSPNLALGDVVQKTTESFDGRRLGWMCAIQACQIRDPPCCTDGSRQIYKIEAVAVIVTSGHKHDDQAYFMKDRD